MNLAAPGETYLRRLKRTEPYLELWRDDRKFVELRAGLYATLYFNHVHPTVHSNESVREALIECWNDYWQVVGPQNQRWTYKFGSGVKAHRLPSAKVPPIDAFLRNPENFGAYQYHVHGGRHEDDASPFLFDLAAFWIYGAPEFPRELGHLRLQAPVQYIESGRATEFVELVRRCALRLKVDQAHGGLGFLRTYNEESSTRRSEAQLSGVFSSVDIDVPYVQRSSVFRSGKGRLGIDSPHWLNFLADDWVDKLGGVAALRSQLPDEWFVVEPYEGGLFIQAGAYPEPGHKADGLPPAYVWLNRVLKPIRAPTMVYCMGDEPGQLAAHLGAQRYFTRFDLASETLQVLDAAAPGTGSPPPALASSAQAPGMFDNLRCEAGQPCPRAGYWFTPAKTQSRRKFDKGDVMPHIAGQYGATIWQWDQTQ